MRLRNIPGARETIAASEYVVHEDVMREKKGKWDPKRREKGKTRPKIESRSKNYYTKTREKMK